MKARPFSALALGVALAQTPAFAQTAPAAAPPSAAAPAPGAPTTPPAAGAPAEANDTQKAEAKTHFDKGIALFEEEAWDAALAEFTQSRAQYATRSATKNAALCLRKLHRFDEALDMFDTLLKDFPSLPPEDKAVADQQIKELTGLVGSVTLQGVDPGCKIVIDGRQRGETPVGPLRVAAGTHLLRVVGEGFAPFETQFSVTGAQSLSLPVKLSPLLQGGRLHVEEAAGQNVDVVIDGAVVGKAPWEGMLPVGDHVVMLRGEGDLGTQPSLTSVRLNASTPLTLRAEALPASLRIQPTPATATVLLDGVAIGHGAWTGHVRQGMHLVELRAEGFVSELRRVSAVAKKEAVVEVSLRAAAEGSQGKPGRVLLEADADFGIAPSLGGNVSSKSAPAIGFLTVGHAGYELGSGLGFLLDAGFLSLSERLASHPVALHPVGIPQDNLGSAEDKIRLSGLTVGASAQYHQGEKLPVTGRLGVGVLLATARDARTGTASTNARMVGGVLVPAASYPFDVTESPKASYLYVAPELRQGLRLGAHAEITFGLRALIMVALTQPKWADEKPVEPGVTYRVGQLTFGPQQVTGNLIVVFVPGVGFRADF